MHAHRHLDQAATWVDQYDGQVPLNLYLKNHFKQFRKAGSRDRKLITQLVYAVFRLGRACLDLPTTERIRLGLFLSEPVHLELLQELAPQWAPSWCPELHQRLAFLEQQGYSIQPDQLFAWQQDLSAGVDGRAFAYSMLRQPLRFIRLRPGGEHRIEERLHQEHVSFDRMKDHALGFSQGLDLNHLLGPERDYVVQDLSSQRCARLFPNLDVQTRLDVWDCCAASGGKTLLFHDRFPKSRILDSDIRPSILVNLRKRLHTAGCSGVQDAVLDLTKKEALVQCLGRRQFDVILADLPCSGSGTWARSPEQLRCFDARQVSAHAIRQRIILQHLIPYLKSGGYLMYMTCSVFHEENEAHIPELLNAGLKLEESSLIAGYLEAADSMYAARWRKP